jgi:hypothetical protein
MMTAREEISHFGKISHKRPRHTGIACHFGNLFQHPLDAIFLNRFYFVP